MPAAAQDVTLVVAGDDPALRDVLAANSLTLSMGEGEMQSAADYVAAARADYRRLLTGLYAAGHYGGTISIRIDGREAAGLAPLDAPTRIEQIEIAVDPGPLFSFGDARIAPLAPATALPDTFRPGEPARSTVVQTAVQAGVEAWRQTGHALAAPAAQDIRAVHADSRLDVAVTLAPGPLLTFGPLSVTGNEAVRTARVIEIAGLPVGQVYDPDEVDLAARRLRRTGAFDAVALVEAEVPGPGATLPVTAQVTEMPPRRIGFGAELSSVDGLALTAYWLHRNLMGGAERFRIDGEITGIEGQSGGPDARLGLSFSRPATVNAETDLTAEAALERLDEPDYRLTQATAEVAFVRHVRDDLTFRGGFGLITAREETTFRTRDYTLLTMPLGATLDLRDDPLDATSGYYIDAEVTSFLGIAGGDDGSRIHADARYYRSFGDRMTLAVRGQIGTVIGADLLAAPRDFLFYSGGGGTVRGQPYQDLGIAITRDFGTGPAAIRLGGRSFVGAQIEARVDVTQTIGLVGFYDFGAIDIDSFPGSDSDWHAGAGIGLRYDTVIGPIRLDLATPASGPDMGETLQVYIGIGQAF